MTLIEAAKQALEALENLQGLCSEESGFVEQVTIWTPDAIYALRTAIAEAEKQEPVAWMDASETALSWENYLDCMKPLYTTPPAAQRLTAREIELLDGIIEVQLDHARRCDSIANRTMADKQKGWDMERVALLQKLKENNHG
jgi:hypothetical protein